MTAQVDYQILLQESVRTALAAAKKAKARQDTVAVFAYYDILDTIKTQAEAMDVPLAEIGLAGIDLDALVKGKGNAHHGVFYGWMRHWYPH